MLITVALQLAGCAIPTLEDEPYEKKDISQVQPGESSRDAVLELFGKPHVSRSRDAVWIYGEFHRSAVVITGLGPYSIFSLEDYQFLVVEFEEDTVESIELVEHRFGCSSNGICLRYGWRIPKFFDMGEQYDILTSRLNQYAVVASVRADDELAKEFQRVSSKCSLYIYQEYEVGRVTVDSLENILVSEDTYLHFLLEPGRYRIEATHGEEFVKRASAEERFECGGGEIVFAEITESPPRSGTTSIINLVGRELGGRAVKNRDLVLVP